MSTENPLSDWLNWSVSIAVDYSDKPRCGNQLDPAYLVEAYCELPDVEAVHILASDHCGRDRDGMTWYWNAHGARMVTED